MTDDPERITFKEILIVVLALSIIVLFVVVLGSGTTIESTVSPTPGTIPQNSLNNDPQSECEKPKDKPAPTVRIESL